MRPGLTLVLLVVPLLLPAAAQPAQATCHLPAPGHCAPGTPMSGTCPAMDGSVRVECPVVQYGQLDAVDFEVGGVLVHGQAFPTVLIDAVQSAHEYPIGSQVTLVVSAKWVGNGTPPEELHATYVFDARAVNWTSPPATPDAQQFPDYPTYPFTLRDFSGRNTTFQWTFQLPDSVTEGTLRIPIALALRDRDHEVSGQSDMVLTVVSKEQSVIPPPPFWKDPAFILLVGVAIGLAVGHILFGKPKTAAHPSASAQGRKPELRLARIAGQLLPRARQGFVQR